MHETFFAKEAEIGEFWWCHEWINNFNFQAEESLAMQI